MIKQRIIFFLLAATISLQAMAAGPGLINYSGRLTDNVGAPVTSLTAVTFTFWNQVLNGAQLGVGYDYQAMVDPNTDGVYSVAIGDGEPVPSAIFDSPEVWLNVNVGGEDLAPRARITSVGYAFRADTATTAAVALALDGDAFIMAPTSGSPIEKGNGLLAAYAQAKMLTPGGENLANTNRAVVLVPPGRYDLGTNDLVMNTEFVDLVGLSSARADQHILGTSNGDNTGVLRQTANNVRIENLTVECTLDNGGANFGPTDPAAYFPDSDKPATVIRNCEFQADDVNAWNMRLGINYSGNYENCTGGQIAFGGYGGTASGAFTDCTGGTYAFGGNGGTASGVFTDCTGGGYAFGGLGGTASGTFTDCTGGYSAFGGSGTASGAFTDCTGGTYAFGGLETASGTFTDCTGGHFSFGGDNGTATGTFTDCTGLSGAFGGSGGSAAGGEFYFCRGDANSFTVTGVPAPVVIHCIKENLAYP